jgi:hypothetical protein
MAVRTKSWLGRMSIRLSSQRPTETTSRPYAMLYHFAFMLKAAYRKQHIRKIG